MVLHHFLKLSLKGMFSSAARMRSRFGTGVTMGALKCRLVNGLRRVPYPFSQVWEWLFVTRTCLPIYPFTRLVKCRVWLYLNHAWLDLYPILLKQILTLSVLTTWETTLSESLSLSLAASLNFSPTSSSLLVDLTLVGREEIEEMEEDSTKTGSQRKWERHWSRP